MATFKFGDTSALTLSERITTPSIHLQKDNGHLYVPLFSGNKGSVIEFNGYNYTLGGLKVGDYRVATSREIANRPPIISVSASASELYDFETVYLYASASDPDNDSLTYKWVKSGSYSGSFTNTTSSTTSYTGGVGLVRYSCTATDLHGEIASDYVDVNWLSSDPKVSIYYEGNWVANKDTKVATVTNMQLKIENPRDVLTNIYVYCEYNLSGSGTSSSQLVYKIIGSNGIITLSKFDVKYAGGYSNIHYYLEIKVESDDNHGTNKTSYWVSKMPPYADVLENGKLLWFDDATMYQGYYSEDYGQIYITGHTGSGTPYFQIGGFSSSDEGKTVLWKFVKDGEDITSVVTSRARNISTSPTITKWSDYMTNIDGTTVGRRDTGTGGHVGTDYYLYGVKLFEGWMPNGDFDLILTVGDIKYLIGLHIADPGNTFIV